MKLRRLMRRLSPWLPKRLRFALIRRQVRVHKDPPPQFQFRLAKNQVELEQAYRILHDAYVDMGYSKVDPSGMRITKYFALPTTSTIVALYEGKVVGTMSVIRESGFGLPMEQAFNLNHLRDKGLRIAEVSSLAIDKQFRINRGAVFLPLCKFFYDYVRHYMGLDAVVIAVNPSWADFYEGLLMFKSLKANVVKNYDFANGAPAVGLYLSLKQSEVDFCKCFSGLPEANDLHQFFVVKEAKNSIFPNRDFEKSLDPVMTPKALNFFFREKSAVFETLTIKERQLLWSLYPWPHFAAVLPQVATKNLRVSARYVVNSWAHAMQDESNFVQVRDVSSTGLLVAGEIDQDLPFEMEVEVGERKFALLLVRAMWRDPKRRLAGIRILRSSKLWDEYVNYLDSGFKHP